MPGEYEQLAPIASMAPAGTSRRAFYAKCALMATIATAVVVGSVLVMADRHEAVSDGSELGGAYYAVTKPPAFNFNRECRAETALQPMHGRLFGSRESSCSACPYLTASLCHVAPPLAAHAWTLWLRAAAMPGLKVSCESWAAVVTCTVVRAKAGGSVDEQFHSSGGTSWLRAESRQPGSMRAAQPPERSWTAERCNRP